MKAARIHRFGSPDVIVIEDLPVPEPGPGEVRVRVLAAGVAPWDALIREGKSKVSPLPPLTLGSDLSGVVEATGPGVSHLAVGDAVYGVTNPQFCGAQAEYAVAQADRLARKPGALSHVEAAAVPVVAVTAWQMLFEYAQPARGQRVLILAAGGSVGSFAVQLAVEAGLQITAVAGARDRAYVLKLGAQEFLDYRDPDFEKQIPPVDLILDLAGGETLERCVGALRPDGILVSAVSDQAPSRRSEIRPIFFYAEVTTERLNRITERLDAGKFMPRVGTVLRLEDLRTAHEMLAGAPHPPGKIVLDLAPR